MQHSADHANCAEAFLGRTLENRPLISAPDTRHPETPDGSGHRWRWRTRAGSAGSPWSSRRFGRSCRGACQRHCWTPSCRARRSRRQVRGQRGRPRPARSPVRRDFQSSAKLLQTVGGESPRFFPGAACDEKRRKCGAPGKQRATVDLLSVILAVHCLLHHLQPHLRVNGHLNGRRARASATILAALPRWWRCRSSSSASSPRTHALPQHHQLQAPRLARAG